MRANFSFFHSVCCSPEITKKNFSLKRFQKNDGFLSSNQLKILKRSGCAVFTIFYSENKIQQFPRFCALWKNEKFALIKTLFCQTNSLAIYLGKCNAFTKFSPKKRESIFPQSSHQRFFSLFLFCKGSQHLQS